MQPEVVTMFNDKFIIEASCNYVYRLNDLVNKKSTLSKYLKSHYPDYEIIEIISSYNDTNLGVLTFQDKLSKDVAVIFQGSTNIQDWKQDNLFNFLGKDVPQYEAALNYTTRLVNKGYRISYVSGNSLGGGAAQYVGQKYQHIRTLCVNASPLTHKDSLLADNNIIHIRVNSEFLYRFVMLAKHRFQEGYAGSVYLVNRSLYGNYHYYSDSELAHRGDISFPYNYFYKTYKVNSLEELKEKVDEKKYQKIMLLFEAPSLSKFMSFDLISNNINQKAEYNLDELQHNFGIRIKEINQSIIKFQLANIKQYVGEQFIKIDKSVNNNLKDILKYSLFQINSKSKDALLYDNIYFIIEKSADYFYKLVTSSIDDICEHLNPSNIADDYQTLVDLNSIEEKLANDLIDNLISINNDLYDLNHFSIKEIINRPNIIEFKEEAIPLKEDYHAKIILPIDQSLTQNIVNNKSFIKQLSNIYHATLNAGHLTLSVFSIDEVKPKDLEHFMHVDIQEKLTKALTIYREDIYNTILHSGLLYETAANLRVVNEQLEQLKITLNNLLDYLVVAKMSTKQKRLEKNINDTLEYIDKYIEFNNNYIIF